jgi:hypothetical protein
MLRLPELVHSQAQADLPHIDVAAVVSHCEAIPEGREAQASPHPDIKAQAQHRPKPGLRLAAKAIDRGVNGAHAQPTRQEEATSSRRVEAHPGIERTGC